jgi:large subunit ribosomal protein L23Ae
MYNRRSVVPQSTWDKFSIIKNPLTTESAIKTIEDNNTLVFIVDRRANKRQIRKACKELYNFKVKKINTLNVPGGTKKAYVSLTGDQEALEIASKIGIM